MNNLKILAALGLLVVVSPFLLMGLAAEAIVRACSWVFDNVYSWAMQLLGMPDYLGGDSGW